MPDIAHARRRRIRVVVATGCVLALVGAGWGAWSVWWPDAADLTVAEGTGSTVQVLTQETAPAEYGDDQVLGELWMTEAGCVVIQPSGFTGPAQAVAWPPGWSASLDEFGVLDLFDDAGERVGGLGDRMILGGHIDPEGSVDGCGQGPAWIAGPAAAIGDEAVIDPVELEAVVTDAEVITESIVGRILVANPMVIGGLEKEYGPPTFVVRLVESFPDEAAKVRAEIEAAVAANPGAAPVAFGTARAPMEELGALSEAIFYSRETWATDPSQVYFTLPDPVTGIVHVGVEELSVADGLDRSRTLPSGITVTIVVEEGEPSVPEAEVGI